jgi:hypothetical protein
MYKFNCELKLTDEGHKFIFGEVNNTPVMTDMHNTPVLKFRLSKSHPGYAVSAGDDTDTHVICLTNLQIKLWKVSNGQLVNTIDTKQLKHKMMRFGTNGHTEFYGVAAWTSDVKMHSIKGKGDNVRVNLMSLFAD